MAVRACMLRRALKLARRWSIRLDPTRRWRMRAAASPTTDSNGMQPNGSCQRKGLRAAAP